MGTCLSRCYPETNTSTNGFSSSVKGNERTIKCEYRRIFRGHRNEDAKKWSLSTPKRHKYISSEMPSHLCQSNHTDRSLPNVPIEPLIDSNAECNFVPLTQDDNSSLQREQKHLDSNGFNSHIIFESGDTSIVKSSVDSPKNGYFISEATEANKNKIINELFEKYFEPEQDCISADGVEKFCTDLCLPPDDFRVLLLAWHFEAETMCQFTRKEFCKGFKKLKVDSLQSLRSKIFAGCSCKKCASAHLMSKSEVNSDKIDSEKDEKGNDGDDQLYGRIYPSHEDGPFVTDVTNNREAFKNMYKWSYRFALDLETGQRTLPLDMAMSMWQLVFSKRLSFFENIHPDVNEIKSFSVSQEGFSCSIGIHKSCEDTVKGNDAEKEIYGELPDETSQNHFDPSCRGKKCQPTSEMDIILDNLHHALPLVRSWFQFLFSLKGSLRGITRDTWDMFFTFMESVGDDGSGYNDAEAWPSLFDDFIEWLKDKNHN